MHVYWIWFTMLPSLSLRQKITLLEQFSDPEDIYYAEQFADVEGLSAEALQALGNKDLSEAEKVVKQCTNRNIGILTFGDPEYPAALRNIEEPPLVLYYKGNLPDFEARPIIGVVGTRKATAYGMNTALTLSRQIASCGGLIVSGGAYGIDSMASQGALDVDAQTVIVLGCGVDVVYPRSNSRLFAKVAQNGCLLSEYLPGTTPKPWHFPERNRIISGMARGVLVVEAPLASGALNTARNAMEQGRDVFAVPGNVGVDTSAGSNGLLCEGAKAAVSGWDVLKEYACQFPDTVAQRTPIMQNKQDGPFRQMPLKVAQRAETPTHQPIPDKKAIDKDKTNAYSVLENNTQQLNQDEQKVIACLSNVPKPVDVVIEEAGIPAARVLSILTMLALKGMVQNHPGRLVSVIK